MRCLLWSSTILLTGLLFSTEIFSQSNIQLQQDTADYPYWIEMMQDESVNFYDVQKAFNTYWEDRKITKGSGWKPYKRWEYWTERHIYPDGARHEADKIYTEYQKYLKQNPGSKQNSGNWDNLGPFNIPSKGYAGLGRVGAIAFHPTNSDILYIGAPAGGCWKYDGSDGSWSSTTDDLPTLGVSSIVVDWNDADNVYIGTGDRDAGDAAGMGVFRSTDGGETWEQWNTGMGNKTVGRMIQHPTNEDIIFAATSGGIYKSIDAGENWDNYQSGNFKDIVFKANDPTILFAATGGNFYKSIDDGETWSSVTDGLPGGNRAVIGVTPDDADYVYCLITNGDSFKGLYRSIDGGDSFTLRSSSPNIMSWGCNGGSGGQAWYDLDVAVDPNDKDVLFAGGVNCFRSDDGGVTWDISSHWWGDCNVPAVHADLHILEYNPLNDRLYVGNDGGVYYTDDMGVTWPEISSGLPIGQVYKIGQSATVKNMVMNGYQDNGTSTYYGNDNWQITGGGDGMECAVDHSNALYSYSTVYYGDIQRLVNNGNSHQVAGSGVHGMTESGGWITPFCLHEGNSNVMFTGHKNIWRTTDIKSNNFLWTKITNNNGGNIDVVEHSPANYDIFYYAINNNLYRSDNIMDESPSWTNLSGNIPGYSNILDVEAHPFDENIVYATKGSKIYESVDKGTTWEDISGTLPGININSIAFYVNSVDGLYIGSDAGVYYKDASMDDWIMYSNGLPVDASVTEIEIYSNPDNFEQDVIRAGTYGRGLWSSPVWHDVPEADFIAGENSVPAGCDMSFKDLSTGIPTSWYWEFEGGNPSTSSQKDPSGIMYAESGNYSVTLTVSNAEGNDTKTIVDIVTITEATSPEVSLFASDTVSCNGSVIQLYDNSDNCPTAWDWSIVPPTASFVNGTNQYSQNPEVIFYEAGTYSVLLTATNEAGSNSGTMTDYIHIGGVAIPFSEDFESNNLMEKGWTVENYGNDVSWEITDEVWTPSGEKAAFLNLFDHGNIDDPYDRLISPLLSFDGYNEIYLSFKYAYAQKYAAITDSLIVYVSDNCGESWVRVMEAGDDGTGLFGTRNPTALPFIPETADDWCGSGWGASCNIIDLTDWAGTGNVQIMFESYYFHGNNIFIDDVMISPLTDIGFMENETGVQIYPNPTTGIVNILVSGSFVQQAYLNVINSQGTSIANKMIDHKADKIQLDLSEYPKGIYFISINDGAGIISERVVLE